MNRRLFFIGWVLLSFISCKKDNNDSLPPPTSTGAHTFGCLVDGKVFTPDKHLLASGVILQCNYELIESEYYFILAARNQFQNYSVVINIDKLQLLKDTVLSYSSPTVGPAYGRCGVPHNNFTFPYSTNGVLPGEFKLSKFDLVNQIAAGTFWFDAIDSTTGQIVEIREGRFDVRFTR